MHDNLPSAAHRPWPLPQRPWVMRQTWHDLLFAHWPLPVEILRPLVPAELELDSFDGQAWLAVAPFWMSGIRMRRLPAVPGLSTFPELNVRTYVKGPTSAGSRLASPPGSPHKPGVYFFSLDAGNALAVTAARAWYKLPYFNADMKVEVNGDEITYSSRRRGPPGPGDVQCNYQPTGPGTQSKSDLETFLTERYCLYAVSRARRVFRAEIHHEPWTLQPAQADWGINSVAASHGIVLPDVAPLLHFSKHLDVYVWTPDRLP